MNLYEEMKNIHATALSMALIRNYEIDQIITVGESVTEHTRFQAASVSKMVFTLALLRFTEEKRISLDNEAGQYLGDLQIKDRNGIPARASIRQILSHTGGFNVHGFDGYESFEPLPDTDQILQGLPPANSGEVVQMDSPGKRWSYSGGGFMVLQKLAENMSGLPFEDFMQQNVLKPLGMNDSTFRQDISQKYVEGYSEAFMSGKYGHHLMPEQAAAGLWTTAADLARFGIHIQNILRGKPGLVSRELAQEMVTPQHANDLDLDQAEYRMGLGCFLSNLSGQAYFSHSGGNFGYESRVFFSVAGGNGFCILINSEDTDQLMDHLQKISLQTRYSRFPFLKS